MPEGHTIHRLAREHAQLFKGRTVRASSPQGRFVEGAAQLDGRTFTGTDAYGKHLFWRFEGNQLVHIHLGLYGKFTGGPAPAPEPFGALRLRIEADGVYRDLRGPTACELITPPERSAIFARLGPDPLRRGADGALAWSRIERSKAPMGTILLDQTILAGVGNVYRAELLYRHGVSPHRIGRELGRERWDAFWLDLRRLMQSGVRSGRIVTTEPADRDRRSGTARREDALYVYRREGLPCRRCGTEVTSATLAARTVYWCPTCQPS